MSVNEDYGKYYFTIIDFNKATELFADPDFDGDGDPGQIYEPTRKEVCGYCHIRAGGYPVTHQAFIQPLVGQFIFKQVSSSQK